MKKIVLVLFFMIFYYSNAFANETIKLAIGEWAPFTSESDPKGKLTEKVVTAAFKLEGINVTYSYFPWKRSYSLVEKGEEKYVGTFPWSGTEERRKLFFMNKVPVLKDESVYFHLKSTKFDWNTIEDLKPLKVGVTNGYNNEKIYKSKGIKAQSVVSEDLNFKKLLAGKIDVYDTSKSVGLALINKLFTPEEAKKFTYNQKPVEMSEYYILFSKHDPKNKALADKFDEGMKKLIASGEYEKLMTP